MICKVYEVGPLIYPQCRGEMCLITFITDHSVAEGIINHLKLELCGG
jgi:hypothetical protein